MDTAVEPLTMAQHGQWLVLWSCAVQRSIPTTHGELSLVCGLSIRSVPGYLVLQPDTLNATCETSETNRKCWNEFWFCSEFWCGSSVSDPDNTLLDSRMGACSKSSGLSAAGPSAWSQLCIDGALPEGLHESCTKSQFCCLHLWWWFICDTCTFRHVLILRSHRYIILHNYPLLAKPYNVSIKRIHHWPFTNSLTIIWPWVKFLSPWWTFL